MSPSPPLQLVIGCALGVVIARLFVLGHDACHGSLFSSRRVNEFVGRALFLPSLTPYSLWEIGHNVAHHGYTNLRGHDYVWAPLSKGEFDASPAQVRRLQRVYRTPLGLGLYYLIELWWNKLYFPSEFHVGARRPEHVRDCWAVTAFGLTSWLIIGLMASWGGRSVIWTLLVTWLWPFCVWNALMGFVVYVQHTHPSIGWFRSKREWTWFQAQVHSTPHLLFPIPFSALLHNIMEHTAHHLDTAVPLRELPQAQRSLEQALGATVQLRRWSWTEFFDVTRKCKLYDYEHHRWLDFDGTPTASVSRPPAPFGGNCSNA